MLRVLLPLVPVTVNCTLMAADNAAYGSRKKEAPRAISSRTLSLCANRLVFGSRCRNGPCSERAIDVAVLR